MRPTPSTVTAVTPRHNLLAALERQRAAFRADMMPSAAVRLDRLARLGAMIEKHGEEIAQTLSRDFGNRSLNETRFAELLIVGGAIRHARRT